jgi:hypothetical protein
VQGYPCSTVHWPAVVRVCELKVSSLSPASRCSARRRLPSRGSLGPHFPTFCGTMRRYDCHPARLGSLRLSLASRYLACFRAFVVSLTGSCPGGSPKDHARAFGHPVPQSGSVTRRQVALPSSRVPPVKTCPALRPRWCPAYSPYRTQDCCLPALANRRLSPRSFLRDILLSTTIHISGLNDAACLLATPGSVRPLAGRHAGSLLTGWLGVSQVGFTPTGKQQPIS